MSQAVIDRLADAQAGLCRALDSGSAKEIDAATLAVARALEQVRGVGAWQPTPELKAGIARALQQGEAARVRTRYLGEHGRTRLGRLQAMLGRGPVAYGRDGRFRAA